MTRTIAISGASGNVARRVTQYLLPEHPHENLRLITRTPEKLLGQVPRGVQVFAGDYNSPELLDQAYAGVDTLFLVSSIALSNRRTEHNNAYRAAKRAGVQNVVWTSYVGIHPRNPNIAAQEHIIFEGDVRASGLNYTILRNATYALGPYKLFVEPALKSGKWVQLASEGRCAPIARGDVARTIAKCLLHPELHAGATYEVSGAELLTFRQMWEIACDVFNTSWEFIEVSAAERLAMWDALGVPRHYDPSLPLHPEFSYIASDELVSSEEAIAQGFQAVLTDHVKLITGARPRTMREVFEALTRGVEL